MQDEPSKAEVYRELRAHHGRMHDTLYGMPPSFAVVVGALWYFAGDRMRQDPIVSAGIFTFTAFVAFYLARAFRTFAARTQEMRWHIETMEGGNGFTNDTNAQRDRRRRYLRLRRLDIPTWLAEGMDSQFAEGANQRKTRDAFTQVMNLATALSLAGAVYAMVRYYPGTAG